MPSSRAALAAILVLCVVMAARAHACPPSPTPPGVSRIVEIDASHGPIFGSLTAQAREGRFLGPKEVVLTFDDGPLPGVTGPILDTLDRFCTKATFFPVGRMAAAYPAVTREILARGHTVGSHTWSHPILTRLPAQRAREQIDSGFAAVAFAAGQPIAPFFRFPGLNDSPALLDYLQTRGIAAFTVDVVSNDSYIADPGRLIERTLQQAHAQKGGILLFHDIKYVTARALPTILRELRADGFTIVHLRAKSGYVPAEEEIAAAREHMERTMRQRRSAPLAVTDFAAEALHSPENSGGLPVTALAPAPRDRLDSVARPSDPASEVSARKPASQGSLAFQPRRKRAPTAATESAWSAGWRRFWQGLGS